MRTLTHAQILASQRLARFPLPGLTNCPTDATLDAIEDVRSLASSHGPTVDTREAVASVRYLASTGR